MPDLSSNLNDQLPDGRPVKRFYALQDLFLSYFHPDWMLDDSTTDLVLERFKADAPSEVPEVVDELDQLLAIPVTDQVLQAHVMGRYSLNYNPEHDGMTMRQWLQHARSVLATGDGQGMSGCPKG